MTPTNVKRTRSATKTARRGEFKTCLDTSNANRYFASNMEVSRMKVVRILLVVAVVAGSLAAAYFLGANSKEPTQTSLGTGSSAKPIEDSFVIPTGLTVAKSDPLPAMKDPTGVLLGEVKVPKNLLNGPEQVATEFIVPDLKLEVK